MKVMQTNDVRPNGLDQTNKLIRSDQLEYFYPITTYIIAPRSNRRIRHNDKGVTVL